MTNRITPANPSTPHFTIRKAQTVLFQGGLYCYVAGPVSHTPPWQIPFKQAAALGYQVAVCDTAGRLLACSNLEGHVVAGEPRLLGEGWWEFVDPAELPAVKAYFGNQLSGDAITYSQLCQLSGKPAMADITIVKTWVGGSWLCYGAVRARQRLSRRRQLEHGD